MSDEPELPPDPVTQRALVIWYDDETNRVTLDADAFSWLEVPQLLRAAQDIADDNYPLTSDPYTDELEDE